MPKREVCDELLDAVPDEPRWIEARALVLSGDCGVFGGAGGWVLRNEQPGGRLVVLVGRPSPAVLDEALSGRPGSEVLTAPEDEEANAAQLPGWSRERAVLHELADPARLAPDDGTVRALTPEDSLAHLPAALREEMEGALSRHAVHAAFEADVAASFAYACWRTETRFDMSIDTAPWFRRRGLARRAASALIRAEADAGRRPVWGAMASNEASLRLAEALGFRAVDEIACFSAPNF
ncbi:MAG: GNAT family N-acetyltransferase [Planctomycetota bacterium]